ncbi:hypothetical protein CMK11_16420 [Candidatus Poribacteria bacterium]|nr:hypothetical protein [Candidatus Poribacteria bacterium]
MSAFFLDTSALVKRYVDEEEGSAWMRQLARPSSGHLIYLAWITGPETMSALIRRQRRSDLTAQELAAALAQFRSEWERSYRRLDVSHVLIRRAMSLVERHGLRGYDSVQLAAGIEASALERARGPSATFVSSDAALNAAAHSEGLSVEDPAAH